jgi:DNA replication initiation complex subunit (GINS family)
MDNNELSYKILRLIQQSEQTSPTLTKIPAHFYEQLQKYLHELSAIVSNETNPQKQKLYQEELKNTEKIGHHIYEQREKKIVQAALSTVRSATPDLQQLLPQEQVLFNTLVTEITNARNDILHPNQTQEKNISEPLKKTTSITKPQTENTNPILRITQDIPSFVGTDMITYSLRKDDVLTLPPEMAATLVKQKVAKSIK